MTRGPLPSIVCAMQVRSELRLVLSAMLASACAASTADQARVAPPRAASQPVHDVHSFAEPERVRVTHVALELTLDFEASRARGSARLALERSDPAAPLVLDTHGLEILEVRGADGAPRGWKHGASDELLGTPLVVTLAPPDDAVTVSYATTADSQAMQWLAPEQTADGTHPFLFTQGQSILTRSWIPLQDSPGVRVTYEAAIRAPAGLTAVMSAEALGQDESGRWRFRMDRAIPSYLIALACGRIEFRAISPRAGVWAEPSVVAGAREELSDMEAMIAVAERLYGPYRWGRYDLIVLPPAFPYGGMENPRLTFATPTILAGDRSLVSLVAHELAHSWSGNLVTNAIWGDSWLNEGFTCYLEQRIMEELYGVERSEMEQALDYDGLVAEMAELEPWQQSLHVELAGKDPDDGSTGVAYQKGALFLRRLEALFGRQRLDAFLERWFDAHAFQSVTTADFERALQAGLLEGEPELARAAEVERWLYAPGLPEAAVRPQSSALLRVERELAAWTAGKPASELDTDGWVTQQWQHFLACLPDTLTAERMAELDRAFGFTASGNSEVLAAWLRLAVEHGYAGADARLEQFLVGVGRRKFLTPLYEELCRSEEGRARARTIYARARPRYHAVAQGTIDAIVGWADS